MLTRPGIVSLLFCGITLKHYAYHTMSKRTQKTTKYMFAVLAQLSENFIFIYLGLNLFTQDVQVFKPLFILVTAVSLVGAVCPYKLHAETDRSPSWLRGMLPSSPCPN
jgi:sodium/hydrogen exchanger-like protein 6/7